MKRKIIILLFALQIASIGGCGNSALEKTEQYNELNESFSFYTQSTNKIMDTMKVTPEQANHIFKILTEVGMDDEIFAITKNVVDEGFTVTSKIKTYSVYLNDGVLDQIKISTGIVYPFPEIVEEPPLIDDIAESEESVAQLEPLEIIGHRFDRNNKDHPSEVQLIAIFNRPLVDDELRNTFTTPTYTYKYYITVKEGEDYISDYNNGNTISDVYLSGDNTEYKIESSGNGMRNGYIDDSNFSQDNIDSIKIVLLKAIGEQRTDGYEVINEYTYNAPE